MKKILLLSLCALGLGGTIFLATSYSSKASAMKKKPSLEANICYHFEPSIKDCITPATACLCEVVVKPSSIADFNAAIANNTVPAFFSNEDHVTEFGLTATQVQRLTSSSTIVLKMYNEQTGKYYYAVGTSTSMTFETADFVMNDLPGQQN